MKQAIFNTKTYSTQLEDREGDLLTFVVTVDYKICSEGLEIVKYDYWPKNEDLRASVEDFIHKELFS